MRAMLHLSLGLWNGWLLCVPLILAGGVVTGLRSDVARRMADTSGYTRRERAIAAVASLLPYPMMILSVWSPLTRSPALLGAGARGP